MVQYNYNGFTEKDWKLFRNKIAGWQEAYMEKLCKEYIELLSENISGADRFWKLEKRIKQDKNKKGVLIDMRRSQFIYNLCSLINEGVIYLEDLEDFSDELKKTMNFLCGKRNK